MNFREDWEFLVKNEALPEERMRAVETGGCPHAAIREVRQKKFLVHSIVLTSLL